MELKTKEPLVVDVKKIRDTLKNTLEDADFHAKNQYQSEIKQRLYIASYLEANLEHLVELLTDIIDSHE